MPFPPIPLEWATDENYDAGADPWSGTPTKVDPTTQTKTKGFVPESPASGQQLNYLLNKFAETCNALAALAVTRFDPVKSMTQGAAQGSYGNRAAFNSKLRRWYLFGLDSASVYYSTNYGADWTTVATGVTSPGVAIACNNDPASADWGNMLFKGGDTNTTMRRYNPTTAAFSAVTAAVATVSNGLVHDPVNHTYIMVGTDNPVILTKIQNAPDTTYTWTNRSAGIPSAATLPLRTGGTCGVKVSDTGVCMVAGAADFLRSADGGTTWTREVTPSAMINEHAFAWISERSEWVYGATNGAIYASPDGITWTLRCATNPARGLSATGYIWSMESLGSALWALYNLDTSTGSIGGIMYSLDGGATWGFCSNVGTDGGLGGAGFGGRGMLHVGDDSVFVESVKDATNATLYKGIAFLRNFGQATFASITP